MCANVTSSFPTGSVARFISFHKSANGFIFPLISVKYGSTNQVMFSVDGVFPSTDWSLHTRYGQHENALSEPCIYPKNCAVFEMLTISSDQDLPFIINSPRRCQEYEIK